MSLYQRSFHMFKIIIILCHLRNLNCFIFSGMNAHKISIIACLLFEDQRICFLRVFSTLFLFQLLYVSRVSTFAQKSYLNRSCRSLRVSLANQSSLPSFSLHFTAQLYVTLIQWSQWIYFKTSFQNTSINSRQNNSITFITLRFRTRSISKCWLIWSKSWNNSSRKAICWSTLSILSDLLRREMRH